LYAVVFVGFVGYSLMITVFTPMIMNDRSLLLDSGAPMSQRVILLGFLLCLCWARSPTASDGSLS
jgi:hypothetical protein